MTLKDTTDFFSDDFPQFYEPYMLLGGIDRQSDVAVYHAINRDTGGKVAIKFVNINTFQEIEQLYGGIQILTEVQHPSIVSPLSVSQLPNGLLQIVMPDAPFLDLYFWISENGPMTEKEAIYVMIQLVEATKYLHSLGIIHNSLRLENVLINKESPFIEVRLTGFTYAHRLDINENTSTVYPENPCISPDNPYASPELISSKIPTLQTDIYSLGILFYEMIAGSSPSVWISQNPDAKCDAFTGERWRYKSEPLKNMIKCMLSESPESRPTADDLTSHDLFKDIIEGRPKTEIENDLIRFFENEMEQDDSPFLQNDYLY